jgi:hypothetical protein
MATNVLSRASGNEKTRKSLKSGKYDGRILYLAPEKQSGLGNVCPFASEGCKKACLYTSGHGRYQRVKDGRIRKTKMFFQEKETFFCTLHKELTTLDKAAKKKGKIAFCRLNGTSDINWGNFKVYQGKNVFQEFPDIQFYDYTKDFIKLISNKEPNYKLTFSLSEHNREQAFKALEAGFNIAAVFRGTFPKKYLGFKVYDGDKEDLQFLYPKRVIIGLRPKGRAKYDKSGFVINLT